MSGHVRANHRGLEILLAATLLAPALTRAQDAPLVAGRDGVPLPRKIVTGPLIYPPVARVVGIEGITFLRVIIDASGVPTDVTVIHTTSPLLGAAAADTVRSDRYEPLVINGVARPVEFVVPVLHAIDGQGLKVLTQLATASSEPAEFRRFAIAQLTLLPEKRRSDVMKTLRKLEKDKVPDVASAARDALAKMSAAAQ